MSDLQTLNSSLDEKTRLEVLKSVLAFPKTTDLLEDNEPLCTISQEALNLDQAINEVALHSRLLAKNFAGNLQLVLRDLKLLAPIIRFCVFHCVQIYHGGVAILRIVNRSSSGRRLVTVDLAKLGRELKEAAQELRLDPAVPRVYRSYIKPYLPLIGGVLVTISALVILQWRGGQDKPKTS